MKKKNGDAVNKNRDTSKNEKTPPIDDINLDLKTIIDDIPVLLCRYRPDFTLTYANATFKETFGIENKEINGLSLMDLLPETDIKTMAEKHRAITINNTVITYEHEAISPCGEKKLLRKIEKGIFEKGKKPVEYQSMCFDITAVKNAEVALQESEERYRSMVQNMREYVYVCSSDYKIEFMNPAMEKRVGKKALGNHCYEMIHEKNKRCEWCRYEEVLKGHYYEVEQLSPKDNRYYMVSNAPVYHVDGSISKMTIYRDITEQKQYEQRVERDQRIMRALSQKVMTAMEEERERVARDLHDSLGQKVVAIQLKSGMLLNAMKDSEHVKELESLLNLTEDTTSELEHLCKGLRPPVLTKVGLSAALQELAIDTENIWGNKISTWLDDSMDNHIGDIEATNMYRIAQEALNNIVKHSGGTKASMSLKTRDGEIELEVRDNGNGFDLKYVGTSNRLGLVGMRERADICGGMFGIRSAHGSGTAITVSIPINRRNK